MTRFVAGLSFLALTNVASAQILVRQGGSQFSIQPIVGPQTAAQFYAYGVTFAASADTGLERGDTSLLFVYEESSGPQALVMVHDIANSGSGGDADFRISGLPGGTSYTVYDDPPGGGPGGDSFFPDPPVGGATTAQWHWNPCCTDGAAIAGLEGNDYCIAIDPSFFPGIDTWQLVSGPGVLRTDLPSLTATTYLCRDCQTLTCPAVVNAECTGSSTAFVPVLASGGSLCAGGSIQNDRTGGGLDASDIYPLGSTTVIFTLTDTPGFTTTCETLVVVEDTALPLIATCPVPLDLPCAGAPLPKSDPRVQAWLATFTASDTCSPVTLSDDMPFEIPLTCGGSPTLVTFAATDGVGNAATCQSTIAVEDHDPPTVSVCPTPLVLECDDPAGIPASDPRVAAFLAEFAAQDDCGPLALTNDAPGLFPSGCGSGVQTNVTFNATDSCLRVASCTSSVTVRDTTPPVITCPSDLGVECSARGGTPASDPAVDAWRQSVTAGDDCGNVTTVDDLPALVPAGCPPGRDTNVLFTATDDCLLDATCSAKVTVLDTSPPVISSCPVPLALECDMTGGMPASDPRIQAFLASFAADDICHDRTLANSAPAFFPSGCAPGANTAVDFTATDSCANAASCASAVTIADTTAPVITAVPPPTTLECTSAGGVPVGDPGAQAWLALFTASDSCSATVALGSDAPALFPSACVPGQTTVVNFTATDNCANATSTSANLTVVDTTAPSLLVPTPVTLECNEPGGVPGTDPRVAAWLALASASDICDGASLSHDVPAFLPSACSPGQATTITFESADNCANLRRLASTIFVRDTTPPDLTVPAPLTLECNAITGVPASDPRIVAWRAAASASDICDGATITDDAPAFFTSGCVPGTVTTVTFTAVDDCGNATSRTSTVTVVDTTPPDALASLRPLAPASPTSPRSPREPSAPVSACSPPTTRDFIVECAASDTCDAMPTVSAALRVTNHDVTDAGSCALRVDLVDVACDEVVTLRLLAPPCPARAPSSPAPPVTVDSRGIKVISGEAIVLEVTATDNCGNAAVDDYDPSKEPSPLCDEVLEDGTCCPAIAHPPDEKCKVPPCGRCQPGVSPPPVATAIAGVGLACDKADAASAAITDAASRACVGAADPMCGGSCGFGSCAAMGVARTARETRLTCAKVALDTCKNGKGYRCEAAGSIDCGCACR